MFSQCNLFFIRKTSSRIFFLQTKDFITSRLDEAIYVNKLLPVVCKVIQVFFSVSLEEKKLKTKF